MRKFGQSLRRFLLVWRPLLGGTIAEYLIVALIYTAITIVLTNFVLFHITTQLFTGSSGDATAGFLWLNFADPGLSPFLSSTTMVNYPTGEPLGGPTFVTYLVLWLPLRTLSFFFGPVAGLNLMMLGGFLFAALSGYWLLKRLTGSRLIAFFAGYAIAFVPYNLYKSVSHLAYLYCFPFVLIIAAFYGVWRRPTLRRALILAGTVALAFYTDGYYLLIGSVTVACLLLAAGLVSYFQKTEHGRALKRLKFFAAAAATLAILCVPILYVQVAEGAKVSSMLSSSRASDPASEMRAYRTRWEDFFLPSGQHPVWSQNAQFRAVDADKELRSTPSECMNYIGYGVLLLVLIGLILLLMYRFARRYATLDRIDARSRHQLIFFGTILVVAVPVYLSFMFSPATEFHHHTIYLPGQIMAHFGIGFWRVLARFFIPLHILLVIFAALVLSIIYRRVVTLPGKRGLAVAMVLVMTVLTGFEYLTTYNTPSFDFTKMPAGYTWLKNQHDIKVVAELPMVDALDGKTGYYMTAQIVHGKQLVNMKEPSANRLNNAIGGIDNPETINLAYQRGAQAVITHDIDCRNTVSWGWLVYSGDKNKDDLLCIYKLERPALADDVFVLFGEGFTYTPVRVKPYEQSAQIGAQDAKLQFVDQNFKRVSGPAHVETQLRYTSNKPLTVTWIVHQGAEVIASGSSKNRTIPIVFDVDASKQVTLTVRYDENALTVKDIDTYLYDTVAN